MPKDDNYFERNGGKPTSLHSKIGPALQVLNLRPRKILEIGTSSGAGLDDLRRTFGAECHGVEPEADAVEAGRAAFPSLDLIVGKAGDVLPFPDATFDLVVFGFCLYLCDPADYERIVGEADRVLANPGTLVIADFCAKAPIIKPYRGRTDRNMHKRDFSELFLALPHFRLLSRTYSETKGGVTFDPGEWETVDVLRKDHGTPTEVM
jgi:ubiquinone/menaquinone biosynthesis C-methylase UbiE